MTFPKDMKSSLDMINPLVVDHSILVGGQPSALDLQYLKTIGIDIVINLRPISEEIDFDQVSVMQNLNMVYHHIVVANETDLTKSTAMKLAQVLPKNGEKCLFHCASGNRVGALLAVKAFGLDGYSGDKAIQFGLDSGMTKWLPMVRNIIAINSL